VLNTALFTEGKHPRILKLNIILEVKGELLIPISPPHLPEKGIKDQLTDSEHTEDASIFALSAVHNRRTMFLLNTKHVIFHRSQSVLPHMYRDK
jgi:hypothetical protein